MGGLPTAFLFDRSTVPIRRKAGITNPSKTFMEQCNHSELEAFIVISYDEAIKIAQEFSVEVAGRFPEKVVAVFAIGSLGSDYYRPGQSDIDTVVITNCRRHNLTKIEQEIASIRDRYGRDYHVPKGFGAIVFAEEQLYPPYVTKEELILEILRLKTQSKLLYGQYNIDDIPIPDRQSIIDDAKSFQAWADNEKKNDPCGAAKPQELRSNICLSSTPSSSKPWAR